VFTSRKLLPVSGTNWGAFRGKFNEGACVDLAKDNEIVGGKLGVGNVSKRFGNGEVWRRRYIT